MKVESPKEEKEEEEEEKKKKAYVKWLENDMEEMLMVHF